MRLRRGGPGREGPRASPSFPGVGTSMGGYSPSSFFLSPQLRVAPHTCASEMTTTLPHRATPRPDLMATDIS